MRWIFAFLFVFVTTASAQIGHPVGPNPTATGQAATGQVPGTTTNDNANAGNVGEVISSPTINTNNTVTISNASPAVISDSATCTTGQRASCIGVGQVINFTTTGALPAGLSTGTNYYVLSAGFVSGTSYEVATTPFGTPINTTNAGSGTQTRVIGATGIGTGSFVTIAAVALTAGDWQCSGNAHVVTNGATTVYAGFIGPTNNSATGFIVGSFIQLNSATGFATGGGNYLSIPPVPISLSSSTNYYLEAEAVFSGGVLSVTSGELNCRRMR